MPAVPARREIDRRLSEGAQRGQAASAGARWGSPRCYCLPVRSNRKKPDVTSRKARIVRSGTTGRVGDSSSRRFTALGRKLGNQGVDEKVKKAGDQSRVLLDFISTRLHVLQSAQRKELLEMKDVREWYRLLAKGEPGYHLPDTTRWHESAHLYLEAAKAIANGNLGRGADLLDRAMEAERAVFDSVPVQVRENFDKEEAAAADAPPGLYEVGTAALCPRLALPSEIHKAASAILNISDEMENAPPVRLRRKWFEAEEEDEEEEEDEDDD